MPRGVDEGSDFEVYIEFSDGRRLNEHRPVASDASSALPARTTVWAESETGKEFKIVVRSLIKTPRDEDKKVHAQVFVDGRLSGRAIFARAEERWTCQTMDVVRDGQTVTLPLAFSPIETVDDPSKAEVGPREVSEIGSITVKLQYGKVSPAGEKVYKPPVVAQVGKVWEQSVKMRSVINGGERANASQSAQAKPVLCSLFHPNAKDVFFYEFRINHATRDVLAHKLGLDDPEPAPATSTSPSRATPSSQFASQTRKRARPPSRSPSSSSLSSSSSSSSSSSDTAEENVGQGAMLEIFKAFMKQQEAKAAEKREAKKLKKEARKKQKREKESRRDGRSSNATIDLTGDSDDDEEERTQGSSASLLGRYSMRARSVKREPQGK